MTIIMQQRIAQVLFLSIVTLDRYAPRPIDKVMFEKAKLKMSTTTTTERHTGKWIPSFRQHQTIVEGVHRTLTDLHYRNIWYDLINRNYTEFIHQMRQYGPKKFYKKAVYNDPTFEGRNGAILWNFTIQYFEQMGKQGFHNLINVFDRVDHTRKGVPTKYATIPLPKGYWEKCNKEYWATYTDPPGLNPWRNTIPYEYWRGVEIDEIHVKDPYMVPFYHNRRVVEVYTRPEWSSTTSPFETTVIYTSRDYNMSNLWKFDIGFGNRIYTQPNYYY